MHRIAGINNVKFFTNWRIQSREQLHHKSTDEVIHELVKRFKRTKFVVLYSGGKDSSMVAHLLHKKGMLDHLLTIDTGIAVGELWDFVKDETKRQGWSHVVRKSKYNFDDWVYRHGHPAHGAHRRVMGMLKYDTMRTYMLHELDTDNSVYMSGVRGETESVQRGQNYAYPIDNDGRMFMGRPIFYKTDSDVINYCVKNDIRISPAYEKIHLSGDCLCGSYNDLLERYEISQHYPREYAEILRREKMARESPYLGARINWEYGNVEIKHQRYLMCDQLMPLFGGLVRPLKDQIKTDMKEVELRDAMLEDTCHDCRVQTGMDEDV